MSDSWKEELQKAQRQCADYFIELEGERSSHAETRAALEQANQNFVDQHRNAVVPAINRADAAEAECARLREREQELLRRERSALYALNRAESEIRDSESATRTALDGTKDALKAEMQRCAASEAECARLREELKRTANARDVYTDWHEAKCNALAAEQRAHRVTQQAWATDVLSTHPRGYPMRGGLPEPVASLARQYDGHPVGTCSNCKRLAPLKPQYKGELLDMGAVCAWGCEPDEREPGEISLSKARRLRSAESLAEAEELEAQYAAFDAKWGCEPDAKD
jgi:hypothetical protein